MLILVVQNDDWKLESNNISDWRAGRPGAWDNASAFPLCPAANSSNQTGEVHWLNDADQGKHSCKVVQVKELESSAESDKEK